MSLVNFNNIKAAEIQPLIDQIWKEPATTKSYAPKANTIKTILEQQTATLSLLETSDRKNEVSVKWVDFCGDTSEDGAYEDDCNNEAAAEGTAKKQDYLLDIFIEDSFSVSEEELETAVVDYDTIVATGTAAKLKNIIERFNRKAVAVIAANKGVNPFPGDFSYDGGTKITQIPSDEYNGESLIPYLLMVAEYNTSRDLYLLDGGSMFQDYYKAGKYAANDNGKAPAGMFEDIEFRHDIKGFAANSLSDTTFMIDKGSLAIANRAKWPNLATLAGMKDGGWTHTSNGNFMRYSIPINIPDLLPMTFIIQGALVKQQLMVDVQHSVVCTEAGVLLPTWKFKLRAGVFANPIRCNTGNTGILAFQKVSA